MFDAYGTLFDVYSIGQKDEKIFPGYGGVISILWRDKQIEYSRLVSLSDPSAKGSRFYESFWSLTRYALEYSLIRLDLQHTQAQVDELMDSYSRLDAYPESVSVLREVRAIGLSTAILSNGSPEMLSCAAKTSGLQASLDHVIFQSIASDNSKQVRFAMTWRPAYCSCPSHHCYSFPLMLGMF